MRIRIYEDILAAAQNRKSMNYYNIARLTKYCFTGDVICDVREANHYINKIESANTAHGVSFFFKWAFRIMYRSKFNPKKLIIRPAEISKKTTRLTLDQIEIVRKKYKEWIDDRTNLGKNMVNFVIKNRTKYYYAFEALLCSGMRIGELCAIDFVHMKDYRVF